MTHTGLLADQIREHRTHPEFIGELIALDFLEETIERMRARGVTRAKLARTLGVSRPAVSQMFGSGAPNMTLLTMVRLVAALDGELTIKISDRTEQASAPDAASRLDFAKELSNGQTAEAQEFATAA